MTTAALLQIILAGLNNLAELSALFGKVTAEGRDLTPEEVAMVRGRAVTANDALQADLDGTVTPAGAGGPGEESPVRK